LGFSGGNVRRGNTDHAKTGGKLGRWGPSYCPHANTLSGAERAAGAGRGDMAKTSSRELALEPGEGLWAKGEDEEGRAKDERQGTGGGDV